MLFGRARESRLCGTGGWSGGVRRGAGVDRELGGGGRASRQPPCSKLSQREELVAGCPRSGPVEFWVSPCSPRPPPCGIPWAYSSPSMCSPPAPLLSAHRPRIPMKDFAPPLLTLGRSPGPVSPPCRRSPASAGSSVPHGMLSQSIPAPRDNLGRESPQTSC